MQPAASPTNTATPKPSFAQKPPQQTPTAKAPSKPGGIVPSSAFNLSSLVGGVLDKAEDALECTPADGAGLVAAVMGESPRAAEAGRT